MENKENAYLPPVIIILFYAIYYFFGHGALLSSVLIISLYLLVVPTLFFTYGSYIEKLAVENQIKIIATKIKKAKDVIEPTDFPPIPNSHTAGADKAVEDKNNEIIKNSLTILIPIFAGGLLLFAALYYYFTRKRKYSVNLRRIFKEVLILLLLIIIVEMVFFALVTRNYRALTTNSVMEDINEEVKKRP